jgi:hypothetical protein
LQDEIDQANAIRRAIREAAPGAVLDESEGNLDSRVRTYVAQNGRALTSLRALEPARLFRYDDLDINWHTRALASCSVT